MNPYSGLIDLLEADKVIEKSGAWLKCTFPGEKTFSFQSTKMDKTLVDRLLSHPLITAQARQFEDKLRIPETPEELGEADPAVDLLERKEAALAVLTEAINLGEQLITEHLEIAPE